MNYIAIEFLCNEQVAENVSFILQEKGYEGSVYENGMLTAYCREEFYRQSDLNDLLQHFELQNPQKRIEPDQNWNTLWESNFKDQCIENQIHIRAPFHKPKNFPYEIIIHPKMAFGTGHHSTTQLVLRAMIELDFTDKKVLDMGCGSGILAIMASLLGATEVLAIDYDINSIENTTENVQLNKAQNVKVLQAKNLDQVNSLFDIILSNIIKNVNMELLPQYLQKLKTGGIILLCGMLIEDRDDVLNTIKTLELELISEKTENNWIELSLKKIR